MTPLEILATIFAVFVLVKLIIVTVSPNLWMNVAGAMLKGQVVTTVIYLVLAGIVGHFVFSGLTIIQIAAVMLLTSLLAGAALAPYSRVILTLGEEMVKEGINKAWPAMVIWAVLAIWVLYTVFAGGR
ncbi:MAG: hypothetical protein ACE5IC_10785 [Candidatus Brocadiales bacterium]